MVKTSLPIVVHSLIVTKAWEFCWYNKTIFHGWSLSLVLLLVSLKRYWKHKENWDYTLIPGVKGLNSSLFIVKCGFYLLSWKLYPMICKFSAVRRKDKKWLILITKILIEQQTCNEKTVASTRDKKGITLSAWHKSCYMFYIPSETSPTTKNIAAVSFSLLVSTIL